MPAADAAPRCGRHGPAGRRLDAAPELGQHGKTYRRHCQAHDGDGGAAGNRFDRTGHRRHDPTIVRDDGAADWDNHTAIVGHYAATGHGRHLNLLRRAP